VKHLTLLGVAALGGLGADLLHAQTTAVVSYEHYAQCQNKTPAPDGCHVIREVTLAPGGRITIRVSQTNAEYFELKVQGVTKDSPSSGSSDEAFADAFSKSPTGTLSEEIPYDSRYGGYIVTVEPKRDIPSDESGKAFVPGAATIVVTVKQPSPNWRVSGGINLAFIQPDRFAARRISGADGYTIVRDRAGRDDARVGFSTVVNFKMLDCLWPGIGIGVETDGEPNYYFGLGFRASDDVFVNVGAVLANVPTLPSGRFVGDTITDPNVLTTLSSRRAFGFSLGVSFAFLGRGQPELQKPFAAKLP
jgi:hypothetical protein